MKYRVILFDLDGTLLDTDELIVKVFEELFRLYRNGKMTPKEDIYYFSGPPLLETMKREFIDQDPSFMIKRFESLALLYFDEYVTTYPETVDTLNELRRLGLVLGVVTNKARKSSLLSLERLNLREYFDAIVTIDDVKEGKPNEEGILKAMRELNHIEQKEVLYVGDNTVDYLTAVNAKVDSALVVWGPRILDNKVHPNVRIFSYKELIDYVKKS